MKTIKFRGKSSTSKIWKYGIPANIDDGTVIIEDEGVFNDGSTSPFFSKWDFVYSDTVSQFSGLYDKNEKAIYEHDYISIIYKYEGIANGCAIPDQDCICEGEVVYMDGFACFGLRLYKAEYPIIQELKECPYFTIPLLQFELDYSSIEVLGNMFDNPELLK